MGAMTATRRHIRRADAVKSIYRKEPMTARAMTAYIIGAGPRPDTVPSAARCAAACTSIRRRAARTSTPRPRAAPRADTRAPHSHPTSCAAIMDTG